MVKIETFQNSPKILARRIKKSRTLFRKSKTRQVITNNFQTYHSVRKIKSQTNCSSRSQFINRHASKHSGNDIYTKQVGKKKTEREHHTHANSHQHILVGSRSRSKCGNGSLIFFYLLLLHQEIEHGKEEVR